MRTLTVLGLALVAVALVVAVATGGVVPRASAQSETIAVTAATVAVGSQGSVSLQARDMPAPGLGAWSISVVYDPEVLQQMGCVSDLSVCNPNFAADTVRIAGASPNGLEGDATLATFTFRCLRLGSSNLSVTVDVLADATPGDPQDIVASVEDGSLSCIEPATPSQPTAQPTATTAPPAPTPVPGTGGPPSAGFGPGSLGGPGGFGWIIAGLAGAGIAWLSAGVAGAGLAAVTGFSPLRPQRAGEPRGATGPFLPRMKPVGGQPAQPAPQPQPKETPQQRAVSNEPRALNPDVQGFRPPQRPDRSR